MFDHPCQSISATPAREARRPAGTIWLQLAAITIFWGATWPMVKAVLDDMGPVTVLALRFCGSALLMVVLAPLFKQPLVPLPGERLRLTFIGLLQTVIPLSLSSIAMQYVAAGRTAVLVYTMPLWALPLGWWIAGERITLKALLGSLIGFAGILCLFNPRLMNWHDPRALFGNAITVFSAMLWATATCFYRRYKWQTSFYTQTCWQVFWGGLAVLPEAFLLEGHRPIFWTAKLLGVLMFTWFFSTGLSYMWWGKVLSVMPAARAGLVASFSPVVALLVSAPLTGERITPGVIGSMALIGTGVVLTLRGK